MAFFSSPAPAPSPGKPTDSSMDDYRIGARLEIQALLKQMHDARTLVSLSGPGGASYTTVIWAIDAQKGSITFSAEDGDNRLQSLLESQEVVATAYLDSIKVQFDVDGLVRVHSDNQAVLSAPWPHSLLRFQRRAAFRVKPLVSSTPVAEFCHPGQPSLTLSLRVMDISLSGVALFMPNQWLMLPAGLRIDDVQLLLDEDTRIECGIVVHHITAINPESQGCRLGCELVKLDPRDRTLALYVHQTQKRRQALSGGKD